MMNEMMAVIRASLTYDAVSLAVVSFLVVTTTIIDTIAGVSANHGVFSVKYRYAGRERSLSVLKEHDSRRQLRILAGVDLPLGGTSRPDGVGLVSLFHSFAAKFMLLK